MHQFTVEEFTYLQNFLEWYVQDTDRFSDLYLNGKRDPAFLAQMVTQISYCVRESLRVASNVQRRLELAPSTPLIEVQFVEDAFSDNMRSLMRR